MEELENPERQGPLRKYLPYLWIPPFVLILLLGLIAYFAR